MLKRLICFLLAGSLAFSLSPVPLTAFEGSPEDLALLNKIEKDTFQYFTRFSDKMTGLTKDSSRPGSPCSVAATGFALAAYAIGGSRGWIAQDYAYARILTILQTLRHKAAHQKGFFYHFLDARTGKRVWGSEASSIDTALAVAGALLSVRYYPGTEVERLTREVYERIDWKWMMNHSDFICMGWTPESKFLPYYWDSYSELMVLVALAVGSPTFPVPPRAWGRWLRPAGDYNGRKIIYAATGSLFTYQFSHAYIDFRDLDDRGTNFFENSREATLANREYSMSFSDQHKGYTENSWGLSACVGPGGYKAYGGKPGEGLQDGTLAPYAALSSIVFTPEESTKAMRFFYESCGKNLYGEFGFKDAFNLDKNWWANEYLGIDQGITLLMLENYLNGGTVWRKFMELPAVKRWIELTGLEKHPIQTKSF